MNEERKWLAVSCAINKRDTDFSRRLKQLRQRLVGKQAVLAELIGLTEGGVSRWESGTRLPGSAQFHRILVAFETAGASAFEINGLKSAWKRARYDRYI